VSARRQVRGVTVGDHPLTLDEYRRVTEERSAARLAPEAAERMGRIRSSLLDQLAAGVRMYGVNTGYGADSTTALRAHEIRDVQRNTILSHMAGTGRPAEPEVVRGMLLLKAQVLAQGYSAARAVIAERLLDLLNHDILPVVPEQGSLAASGDLVPSGHLAGALLGEGDVMVRGRRQAAAGALASAGLEPIKPEEKEGLALVNGTAFTEALALAAVLRAERLLRAADVAAAITLQAMKGFLAAFERRALEPRPFGGALLVARNVNALSAGAELLDGIGSRIHDPYCLRCVPQVHGASRDAFAYVEQAVLTELNAFTDNPMVFEDGTHLSAGNFHAQPVGIPMDTLTVAVAELASISQRRTQHLISPEYDDGLPPKLSRRPRHGIGLFMLNTTASALVSENKTLSFPASVDSMAVDTTEDHVSMASVAARKALAVIRNTATTLAIELICGCQALDLQAPLRPSPAAETARLFVRGLVAFVEDDRPLHNEMAALANRLLAGGLDRALRQAGIELE
jgi:histidine ammonia-lyase